MRKSVIVSSISTVISRVAGNVSVAGLALRSFLDLTNMRDPWGHWQERYPTIGFALVNPNPGSKCPRGISALAVYPAYRALAVRASSRG